jgi:hypothetical protein
VIVRRKEGKEEETARTPGMSSSRPPQASPCLYVDTQVIERRRMEEKRRMRRRRRRRRRRTDRITLRCGRHAYSLSSQLSSPSSRSRSSTFSRTPRPLRPSDCRTSPPRQPTRSSTLYLLSPLQSPRSRLSSPVSRVRHSQRPNGASSYSSTRLAARARASESHRRSCCLSCKRLSVRRP